MWDSGVVLGKFLEHSVDSGMLVLQGKKIVELGSGCGLVGFIAALLGGQVTQVILTDLPDRLRLLRKNTETNTKHVDMRGTVTAEELVWGEDPDLELTEPGPDYVLGSDVVYSENTVVDLLVTLGQLSGPKTTIFLAGELRNDAILEYFIEAAMKNFTMGSVDQNLWHPDYRSNRVALYVLKTTQPIVPLDQEAPPPPQPKAPPMPPVIQCTAPPKERRRRLLLQGHLLDLKLASPSHHHLGSNFRSHLPYLQAQATQLLS